MPPVGCLVVLPRKVRNQMSKIEVAYVESYMIKNTINYYYYTVFIYMVK